MMNKVIPNVQRKVVKQLSPSSSKVKSIDTPKVYVPKMGKSSGKFKKLYENLLGG